MIMKFASFLQTTHQVVGGGTSGWAHNSHLTNATKQVGSQTRFFYLLLIFLFLDDVILNINEVSSKLEVKFRL